MSQTMKRDAREAMPATKPRDAEQAGVVNGWEGVCSTCDGYVTGHRPGCPEGPGNELSLSEALANAIEFMESVDPTSYTLKDCRAALAASPLPQPTPEAREAGDGALERLEDYARWLDGAKHSPRYLASPGADLAADLRIAITRARAAEAAEAALKQALQDRVNACIPCRGKGRLIKYVGANGAVYEPCKLCAPARALLTGSKQ